MNINDEYKIEINSLDHQGRGIGRINNQVVFVPNTLPGEIGNIRLTKIQKKFLEGSLISIEKYSDDRIKPTCPYAFECGGCDLMHLSYSNQLKYKEDKIKNIMERYASLSCVNSIIGNNSPLNYRNKVTFQVNKKVGLYKKKSYELINVDKCLLIDNRINELIPVFNNMDLDGINQIVVRTSIDELMVVFYCDREKNIAVDKLDCNVIMCVNNKYTTLKGNNYIVDKIGDKKYKVSPTSFFQVNSFQTKNLYDKAKEYLELDGTENVLDLYCGTGTIGIYVSDNAKNVFGIEINKEAIEDAKYNAKLNNVHNINFVSGDTGKELNKVNFKPDKIIVDPPRAGLDKKVINQLFDLNPKRIVYVSCDPMTLARDLKLLKEKYDVKEITPVDMFSNTYHVECVSVLYRKD